MKKRTRKFHFTPELSCRAVFCIKNILGVNNLTDIKYSGESVEMITRAYKKNMVIVRNIESDTVEEAYLFIREDAPMPDESVLVREAGRIIRACGSTGKKGLRIPSAVFWFSLGVTFALLFASAVYYFLL